MREHRTATNFILCVRILRIEKKKMYLMPIKASNSNESKSKTRTQFTVLPILLQTQKFYEEKPTRNLNYR